MAWPIILISPIEIIFRIIQEIEKYHDRKNWARIHLNENLEIR